MKKLNGLWFVIVLCFSGLPALAQPKNLDADARAKIDAVFADYAKPDTPGFALGIFRDGKIVYQSGYGLANLDDDIPITDKTAFHLASLSKQFTASAIALLVTQKKLSLEDPVAKYLPETKAFEGLKIKHLVYMTSGLVEYTDVKRSNGLPWFSSYYFTIDEAVASSLSHPAQFRPGAQWAYRNINYMLLAKVVEKVSGQSLNDFLTQNFFIPLDMTSTRIDDDTTTIIKQRAIGYGPRNADLLGKLHSLGIHANSEGRWLRLARVSPHYGGSGVFSTIADLGKWQDNFDHPVAGGKAFVDLMLSRQKFDHPKDNDAFGLVWRDYNGLKMLDYSGEDLDTNTYMTHFSESHISVVCLSNMLTGDCEGHTKAVMDILYAAGYLR